MGIQLFLESLSPHIASMKFLAALCMTASASATAIIEDTLEVKQAKADFEKAFEAAKAGKHATLAPKPIASAYLADDIDVVLAKARFANTFDAVESGDHSVIAQQPIVPMDTPYVQGAYAPANYYSTYYNNPAEHDLHWGQYVHQYPQYQAYYTPYYNWDTDFNPVYKYPSMAAWLNNWEHSKVVAPKWN